ncbi:MAG: pantetheine-phosphate adenylyltransferase [Lachnospiraceae bacterium]|nr:pantetheine-phosphate adenylyltransferase [Lachnospiraceae bacterium]MDO4735334.1 pantetheine-phosphate adenylyltransferase [Lachnospiraceae bacterium]
MKKKAIYPGTFDPITYGHLDIIQRSAEMVDELIVGVLTNKGKSPLFTPEERVEMIKDAVKDIPNVKVLAFDGLLIEFAKKQKATIIIRGLRAVTDFEYELQMSQTNRVLSPEVDTIFLTTSLKWAYLSSSTVKEVAVFGGDISKFVPKKVAKQIIARYSINK